MIACPVCAGPPARNAQDFKGSSNWVEAELTMQATEANSTACLTNSTCLPLGGFNVWAAMPPLPVNASSNATRPSGMNTTLVVASIDSNGIFHDLVQVRAFFGGGGQACHGVDGARASPCCSRLEGSGPIKCAGCGAPSRFDDGPSAPPHAAGSAERLGAPCR